MDNVLILRQLLDENADSDDGVVDRIAKELGEAEDEFLSGDVDSLDGALGFIDFGIYLCAENRHEPDKMKGLLTKVRQFFSEAA